MRSQLFKVSLEICKNFKIVSNMTRISEENGELAGANLVKWIRKELMPTLKPHLRKKIKIMIFCGNRAGAIEKFLKLGLEPGKDAEIDVDPLGYMKFLSS